MTFIEYILYVLVCLTITATMVLAAYRLEIKHRDRSKKKDKRK